MLRTTPPWKLSREPHYLNIKADNLASIIFPKSTISLKRIIIPHRREIWFPETAGPLHLPGRPGWSNQRLLLIVTHFLLQEHLPYADDSTAVTPKSELNGGIVVDTPTKMGLSRFFTSPWKSNSGQRKICSCQGKCTLCNKMTSFQMLGSNIFESNISSALDDLQEIFVQLSHGERVLHVPHRCQVNPFTNYTLF